MQADPVTEIPEMLHEQSEHVQEHGSSGQSTLCSDSLGITCTGLLFGNKVLLRVICDQHPGASATQI